MGLIRNASTLANDPIFRGVVTAAAAYTATQVTAEPAATKDHPLRAFMASQVLNDPTFVTDRLTWLCATFPDVATLGVSVTDAHETAVLAKVGSLWTSLAGVYYGESFK